MAVLSVPVLAHHGRGATYDMKKRVTLEGTVSKVEWRNPHVIIYMDEATTYSGAEHIVTAPLGLVAGDRLDGDTFPRPWRAGWDAR